MPELEASPKDLTAFQKWKSKHKDIGRLLQNQESLQNFKEHYGVDKSSNFHCPWCFEGRLYFNSVKEFYVCRKCTLHFKIEALDLGKLELLSIERKEKRVASREARKAVKDQFGDKAMYACGKCKGTTTDPETGKICLVCKGLGKLTLEDYLDKHKSKIFLESGEVPTIPDIQSLRDKLISIIGDTSPYPGDEDGEDANDD